ncbi:uncharacterized protein FOMMEDRAFT_153855 [Fomitiporia mediterranea MF3/22]|uniref:uncharacterized protein n=1 Tax=Fomitiporia mediterranea (strain MF3/22) TaxID=694068 RepID=UPI00044086C0|nr:uncharacterized protein FOMMEDRAFT_153855 [Fomitiporia mediterranea MF3/22]EJD04765.1 hypothetical protein FOMMEDRAFT_153855 [Fomitiporia mediterranea MF3/22]
MPMLTALRFHLKLSDGAKKAGSINLAQSSKLEYLYLNGPFLLEFGDKPVHLARSVDLDLGGFSLVQQCLTFLEVAPNLKKLQIVLKVNRPTNNENRSVISRNLQTLSLRDTAPVLLIDKLALPALKVLKYFGSEGGSLLTFVERSLPPLTRLEICGSCAGEETIMRVLPLLPMLQALSLSLRIVSARLFELLSIRTGADTSNYTRDIPNQIVCPKLGWLFFRTYSVVGDLQECADALCNMLESRWDSLKLWDYVIGVNVLHYPFSTTDREGVYRRIQDRKDFLAKCNGERYRRLCF